MKALDLAKWFINKNKNLKNGYNEANTKINKLIYFSNLMYYCIRNKLLIEEEFEKWDNGPVVRKVYEEYRYNNLSQNIKDIIKIESYLKLKVLNIVNFIYSNKSAKELSLETHKHSIWKNIKRNEKIKISNITSREKQEIIDMYNVYKDIDFDKLNSIVINGINFYFKGNIEAISYKIINELKEIEKSKYPIFFEIINGELVFY